MAASNASKQYWVTWPHVNDTTAAEAGAIIWGPQSTAPPQLTGFFLAGPFTTKGAAQAYKNDIGKNTIIPPPGTPWVGSIQGPNLSGLTGLNAIGDLFARLTEKSTWIRVGEAVVALILLDIGLKSLTGTSVIEKTGSGVKKSASAFNNAVVPAAVTKSVKKAKP